MDRALILSDEHLGGARRFPQLDELKLRNLRAVLEQHLTEVDIAILAGDGADSHNLSPKLLAGLCDLFADFGSHLQKVFVLLGNHDGKELQYGPLTPFEKGRRSGEALGFRVVGNEPIVVGDFTLRGFAKDELPPKANSRFLVSHIRVKEWVPYGGGVGLDELATLGYQAIFLGDLHKPLDVRVRNTAIYSIGTFGPTSFSDDLLQASYAIVSWDETTHKVERHAVDFPVFRTFLIQESSPIFPDKSLVEGNIVRFKLVGKRESFDSDLYEHASQFLASAKPLAYEIVASAEPRVRQLAEKVEAQDPYGLVLAYSEQQRWEPQVRELLFKSLAEVQ